MEAAGGRSGGAWGGDGLAAALTDGVAVLGPAGDIVWVNAAFCGLLGVAADALLGTSALDRVHPDELARALDGIDYSIRFPGRTSVAPYRIRRGDGSWLDTELKSGVIGRPDGDYLALVVRDGTSRQGINRALRSVASGDAFERTAVLTCDAIARRWPNVGVAVSFGITDRQEVVAHGLSAPLVAHARGGFGDPAVVAPWEACEPFDDVGILAREDLAPALAEAAGAAGFEGCAIARINDPGGAPCCLVVWFDRVVIAQLEFRHAADELCELLALALERRHHSWQLWHLARHDALTGLLNRIGFFERLEPEQAAARRSPDEAMALLYLDLDDLKRVNDLDGHASGDHLLIRTARVLADAAGPDALVARIGGDEFVIARRFPAGEVAPRSVALAERIAEALAGAGDELVPSASVSIGIVVDAGTITASQALERADAAMYRAKAAGKARWAR
jgi:diguanylate cyclase (GGDEF)-like protein/PAS domain S-box-containing protein